MNKLASSARAYLVVALLACLILFLLSLSLDPTRLHPSGLRYYLNDQVEYVSSARNLIERGTLESAFIYPSALPLGEYRHQPGQALAIAASYLALGQTAFAAVLPSLLAFVVLAVLTFAAARREGGDRAGWVAALATVAWAPLALLSFTAMAELTFAAAAIGAYTLVQRISPRARIWVAPLACAVPFLFRETGALVVLPVAALVYCDAGVDIRRGVLRAGATLASSFSFLLAIYLLTRSPGGSVLFKANLLGAHEADKYLNAEFAYAPLGFANAIGAAGQNFLRQSAFLAESFGKATESLESLSLALGASATVLGVAVAWHRRSLQAAALVAVSVTTWALTLVLYSLPGYVGVRMTLFAWPFVAIAIAPTLARASTKLVGAVSVIVFGVVFASMQTRFAVKVAPALRTDSPVTLQGVAWLKRLPLEKDSIVAVPGWMFGDVALDRLPARTSLPPRNAATLKLLVERHDIEAVVYSREQAADPELGEKALASLGFHSLDATEIDGRTWIAFKRTKRASATPLPMPVDI